MSEDKIGREDVWITPGGMVFVSDELITQIEKFPVSKTITHCDVPIEVSPLDFYATCPRCQVKTKLRSFGGGAALEELFDAVIAWSMKPGGLAVIEKRFEEIKADSTDE